MIEQIRLKPNNNEKEQGTIMAMKNYGGDDNKGNMKLLMIILGGLVVVGLFLQFVWPGGIWF